MADGDSQPPDLIIGFVERLPVLYHLADGIHQDYSRDARQAKYCGDFLGSGSLRRNGSKAEASRTNFVLTDDYLELITFGPPSLSPSY